MIPPRATMRLQLHKGFTFADAQLVAPYMARLGISHLYSSPILTARPGSMHGYDVTDPTRVNPELGGEDGFRDLVATLRHHGLGLILDIVPNHMAVGNDNPWWIDVLKYGRSSVHAQVFDIDWRPDNPLLQGKVLLPVLGGEYGEVLASGELKLERGPEGTELRHYDNRFPIRPEDEAEIAASASGAFDAATEDGRARLHRLLERQHYRLAWWRTVADEINWRRFFDINELAGVRVEIPSVFEATHALLFKFYAEGLIDGVRVDHIDGLSDPGGYCRRLRARLEQLAPDRPAYIVVEKILGRGESLSQDWGVDGTSGYEFMDAVSALQHDPAAQESLQALWSALSGRPGDFDAEEAPARREMLERSFAAQLDAVAGAVHQVALQGLETRDASRLALRRALVEILAHFPVYRSYGGESEAGADQAAFAAAIMGATAAESLAGPEMIELVARMLCAAQTPAQRVAATRFCQLSAPVAAKAVEDTAFYRYGRLLSRNDVGFDARLLGTDAGTFHRICAERGAAFPGALLATATHDHKRGEDVRARLAVISEIPQVWGEILRRWMKLNAGHRTRPDAPSAGDEIMLYQTLIGAWPLDLVANDTTGRRAFVERVARWQEKALHEAKLITSWTSPNQQYEDAAQSFLRTIMGGEAEFPSEAASFVDRIAAAGAVNGLAQVLLKMTVPGVPDFYQGTEFWDLSLVDPDNRQPVDFAAREHGLDAGQRPLALVGTWRDGRIKQAVIAASLALRRERPEVFAAGSYLPLAAEGSGADRIVAFARLTDGDRIIVVAPRLPYQLLLEAEDLLVPPRVWQDTSITLPAFLAGRFGNVLTGDPCQAEGTLRVSELLSRFPLALLAAEA